MKWHPDKNPNDMENANDSYGFDGPKSSGFSHFNFSDADSLFERFFKNSGFDSTDD